MDKSAFAKPQGIYLLSHSVGLLPENAKTQLQRTFFEPWAAGNEAIWQHWMEAINNFRSELGQLFNSDPNCFCPQSNVSSAVTKLVQSLPDKPGKTTILLSDDDFPSIGFALQKATDCQLKFIPAAADILDLTIWDEQMSADVGLVLITHFQSNNGKQLPVADILNLARRKDIVSLVDVAQSAGILPIDLENWQPDAVTGSCVKWTCGGPGAAYLWVNPELSSLCQPTDVGWFSHENPFEFDIHNFRYASDALRFWGGTPSVMPFALAAGSLKILNDRGVEQTRAYNLRLAQQIIDALDPKHIVSPLSADRRGGTLILNTGEQQDKVIEQLRAHQVQFDTRDSGIRLSPHIYNTPEEMELLIHSCFKSCT